MRASSAAGSTRPRRAQTCPKEDLEPGRARRIAALCNIEEERRSHRNFIELETMDATDRFAEKMRELGCECACFPGGRVKLIMPDHIEACDLYSIASQQGVLIRRINQRRDSLEDIFLRAMDSEWKRGELVSL